MSTASRFQHILSTIAVQADPGSMVWVVGGSAGLLLRGLSLEVPPRDLDLYADEEDALLIHQALAAYAVDEQAISRTGIYESLLSHYELDGIQVELVGGFKVHHQQGNYNVEVRDVLWPMGEPLHGTEEDIKIVPLAHELLFNELRGRADRSELIAGTISRDPVAHRRALRAILQRNQFSPLMTERVLSLIKEEEAEGRR